MSTVSHISAVIDGKVDASSKLLAQSSCRSDGEVSNPLSDIETVSLTDYELVKRKRSIKAPGGASSMARLAVGPTDRPIPVNGDSKDVKSVQETGKIASGRPLKEMIRQSMKSSRGKSARGNGPVLRTKLYAQTTVTSGAGAAVAGFFTLQPSNSPEFTGYSVLYDELKVHGVKVRIHGYQGGVSANPCTAWAVGYDPAYGTTPASARDVCESSQHVWGIQGTNALIAGLNGTQTVGTGRPFGSEVLDIKMPTSPMLTDPAVTTTNFPGSWMSCQDTGDSVGYLRYYFTAPGGTNATTMSILEEFDVSFRIRT
jgi:hypothetical protein